MHSMEMHFIYFPASRAVTLLNDCGLLFPDFSLDPLSSSSAIYVILQTSIVANLLPLNNPCENTYMYVKTFRNTDCRRKLSINTPLFISIKIDTAK